MKKLEEFSNKYLSIYADANRIVFDFKYPRLFQRHQSGAFALGSMVDSGAMGNGLTNFLPYDQIATPRNTVISTSATTANITGISNLIADNSVTTLKINNGNYWYNAPEEEVIDVKKLVISSKTKFGRVYLIDSGDRVVRLTKSKTRAIENPYHVQEMMRFFGQFNPHVTKLAAAAILPKERITPEEIAKFENVMFTLNAALGENSAQGYIWSFMFPVLAECKYYDWAYSDRGIISTLITRSSSINNLPFYKNLKTCTGLIEFYKASFGVKGSAFIKKIMELSKGAKESRAGLSAMWHEKHKAAETMVAVPEDDINTELAKGRDLKSFEYNKDGQHMQIFTEVLFGKHPEHKKVGYNYSYYLPFKAAFKSEQFYHLGPLRMFEIYNGLIPIDYWFELKEIPDVMYQMQEDQRKRLREWLIDKPDHIKKKIFLTLKDINGFLDTVRQLNEYKNPDSIPEDLREIYPNGLKIPTRWASASELHDMVSREYNQIKHFAKNRAIKYVPGLDVLDRIDFGNGFTSELPRKTARIVEYGALLKHCVAGYADRCADNNDTVILSINKDGKPHFTLELRCNNSNVFGRYRDTSPDELIYDKIEQEDGTVKAVLKLKYDIHQFKALQNRVPSTEEVSDILQGLKATGVIADIREPHNGNGIYIQGVRAENGDLQLNNGVTVRIPNPRHHVVIRNLEGGDVIVQPGNGTGELNVHGNADIQFIQNHVYNDNGLALANGIGQLDAATLQQYIGMQNNQIQQEVPPEPPIPPMPEEALQHLVNALQDPQQHDNIHIRDQDGVLANAANNGD